jgi:hypothetical protein
MISAADRMNIFSKLSLFYLGIVKRYPFYRQEMRFLIEFWEGQGSILVEDSGADGNGQRGYGPCGG